MASGRYSLLILSGAHDLSASGRRLVGADGVCPGDDEAVPASPSTAVTWHSDRAGGDAVFASCLDLSRLIGETRMGGVEGGPHGFVNQVLTKTGRQRGRDVSPHEPSRMGNGVTVARLTLDQLV